MAKFLFRPQPALDMRQAEERLKAEAVNEARRLSDLAMEEYEAAVARFDEATARAQEADAAGGDVTTAIWYRNWIRSRRRDVVRCEENAEDRRVQLETAERELVEAKRRVRVLERLREKAIEAHRQAERRQEQQQLDELAVLQFAIRQRGENP
jgi:flagellar export protein FliJ